MKSRIAQIAVFFGICLGFCRVVEAASWSNTNLLNGWTGVVSTSCSGANGCTTTGVDSSTGNLLMVFVLDRIDVNPSCTPNDSKSNTWTGITAYSDASGPVSHVRAWYVNSNSPTVGASHTVTCTATTAQSVIAFFVAKTGTATPLDQQNGAGHGGGNTTTLQTGSITPSVSNPLILTYISANQNISSVDSSFTIAENVADVGGTNFGGAVAWITQSSAAPINPTWTVAVATGIDSAGIVSFKQGTGGGGSAAKLLPVMGVGK